MGIEELATELMYISGLGIDILILDQPLGSMDLPAYYLVLLWRLSDSKVKIGQGVSAFNCSVTYKCYKFQTCPEPLRVSEGNSQ